MFDLGGPNFFGDVYMYTLCVHMSVFYVCKAQEKFLKSKFVLEPKKLLQKWLECGVKKSIFTVKCLLKAPTLGGLGPP